MFSSLATRQRGRPSIIRLTWHKFVYAVRSTGRVIIVCEKLKVLNGIKWFQTGVFISTSLVRIHAAKAENKWPSACLSQKARSSPYRPLASPPVA